MYARRILLTAFVAFTWVTTAAAQVFDVTSVVGGAGGNAAGASNGVGFTLSPTFVAAELTITNNTFTGYSNPAFHNPPLATSDELHIGGQSFTFNFAEPVASALVYFTDNTPFADSELDFGILPTVVSGDVAVNGTRFRPTTLNGGLVRLSNINSAVMTHTSTGAAGGLNFAIVVTPVPEPGSVALLCVAGLFVIGRRSVRRLCARKWNNRWQTRDAH